MRIVNGLIVLDDSSLQVDRHAEAANTGEPLEAVEENEYTRIVTSGTWLKREQNASWDEDSMKIFYDGLRMFGTDFEMISKMFPGRSRRQIKLKFRKEEKANPQLINEALTGEKVPMDLEEYQKQTGQVYEDPQAFHDELRREREEHEREQDRQQEEIQETQRQKRAEIAAAGNGDGANSSAKENGTQGASGGPAETAKGRRGRKGQGRKKRPLHALKGGGDEVVVLGSVEDVIRERAAAAASAEA
jgi:transcription factor TFIIIB component B''